MFPLRLDVVLMSPESNRGSVADGEGESKGNELFRRSVFDLVHHSGLTYPCNDDSIVIRRNSFDNANARDEA